MYIWMYNFIATFISKFNISDKVFSYISQFNYGLHFSPIIRLFYQRRRDIIIRLRELGGERSVDIYTFYCLRSAMLYVQEVLTHFSNFPYEMGQDIQYARYTVKISENTNSSAYSSLGINLQVIFLDVLLNVHLMLLNVLNSKLKVNFIYM